MSVPPTRRELSSIRLSATDCPWTTSQARPTRLATICAEASMNTPGEPAGLRPGSGGAECRGFWASRRTAAEGAWLWPRMENQLRAQLNRTLPATAGPSAGALVATTSHWAVTLDRCTA